MRIDVVSAPAFGPLCGQELALAPGLTLIHGPNEAGKSSWHAALYAGLCGQPRGRGRGRKEDQEFRARHRPWDGSAWAAGVRVTLADSRQVELRHDLEGRVACEARDAVLGRDYRAEIMFEGAPDGSRWLGLDRRSFLAVACVRQADLLGVLERPELLKEYVQRVAASPGADASVARALERIEQYRQEHVGRDAANAVKPLRRAREQREQAAEALRHAREAHAAYEALAVEVTTLEAAAAAAGAQLALAQARRALAEADVCEARLARAQVLAARFPASVPVDSARIAAPVGVGSAQPEQGGASGAGLPRPYRGEDAAVFPVGAQRSEGEHTYPDAMSGELAYTAGPTIDPAEVFRLAAALREPLPAVPPELEARVRATKARAAPSAAAPASALWYAVAGALVVAGSALVLSERLAPGVVLLIGAAALALWSHLRRDAASPSHAQAELNDAEAALRSAQAVAAAQARQQEAARRLLGELGLPADPAALERLATETVAATEVAAERSRWQQEQVRTAKAELQALLGGGTLADLAAQARAARAAACQRAAACDAAALAALPLASDAATQEQTLLEAARSSAARLDRARGALAERRRAKPPVVEAEEELAVADVELDRVRSLDRTLELTHTFLAHAQRRVHQDVAPVLAASVRRWLPAITGGRYRDVRVDPETLAVQAQAADGHWRQAALLSHGTAEQIYLLLRVALAEHLTRVGECCPLILDDVTVHCDEERKRAVLHALHTLSAERQVIVFSQEGAVLAWAEANIRSPRDGIVLLEVA